MAEVWKGKATSMRGFEKLVAIKRVLPDLAKKDNFINMFLDEARLSLHLNHANVVQTFDIGTSEGAYFIVMEWVDGMNLKGVLESLKLNGERVPVEQAIFIIIEIFVAITTPFIITHPINIFTVIAYFTIRIFPSEIRF